MHLCYGRKLALLVAPSDHPWHRLTSSAVEDFRALTMETLHPRNEHGTPTERVKTRTPLFQSLALRALLLYVALDLTTKVPGLAGERTSLDENLHLIERSVAALSAFVA